MADVVLERVIKDYGGQIVVDGVDLAVRSGEFVTLLGPSGCGKTTCLRMIAGFIAPSSGRILLDDRDTTSVPPHKRNIGIVFQSYALFPSYTVGENIAFGLRVRKLPRAEIDARMREILKIVQLEHLVDRYPSQLSGGQKQRVALARAVVIRPDVLLLDEPLAALDLKLREDLQGEIRRIQKTLNITALFVTHDQGEALRMSDRIAVMRAGRIEQIDTPEKVYSRPANRYVAGFVGSTNLFEGRVVARETAQRYRVQLDNGRGEAVVEGAQSRDFAAGEPCLLAVRPEEVVLGGDGANSVAARVSDIQYSGANARLDLAAGEGATVFALLPGKSRLPAVGDEVRVSWKPESNFLLPAGDP